MVLNSWIHIDDFQVLVEKKWRQWTYTHVECKSRKLRLEADRKKIQSDIEELDKFIDDGNFDEFFYFILLTWVSSQLISGRLLTL